MLSRRTKWQPCCLPRKFRPQSRRAFMRTIASVSLLLFAVTFAPLLRASDVPSAKAKPPERPLDAKAAPLNIAFISYANPQQVMRDSESVTKYLQKYVGVPVKGFVTLDYGSAIEAMRSGKADLAFVD